ncbi:ankyrin repeat domain-containing protein [Mycobacterium sp. NPDC050041]|uniref:ankyrin repeat domain-containing protein n=1 Tax=Mycobacterium sp. NPDC050041 TaxID=3364293 RepID=UPI003C304924
MEELARYQEGYAAVTAFRDESDLVFHTDFDDNGRSILSEMRIPIDDYIAKGEGPWPWYDLGDRRPGALQIFAALGVQPPPWTELLPVEVLAAFDRARNGWASVGDLIAGGVDADVLDPCGASPLWYAVRSLQPDAALVLIDAGADAGRRIELSPRGDLFTTILHEIVALGRSAALSRALARGVDASVRDADGATPLHRLGERHDHVNPELVRLLAESGADVDATTTSGQRPIEAAATRLLPATVATLLDLGAEPARALTTTLAWWAANMRWFGYRAGEVVDVVDILLAGGAAITDRDRELAARAGDPAVVAALDP